MSQMAKTILSFLSYRVGDLPVSAVVFLVVGLLWWTTAVCIQGGAVEEMSPVGWLPAFLCTALGGCVLFLFCEDFLLGGCLLFCAAFFYGLPYLLRRLLRPKGGDDQ